jgi:hypothetical protein
VNTPAYKRTAVRLEKIGTAVPIKGRRANSAAGKSPQRNGAKKNGAAAS